MIDRQLPKLRAALAAQSWQWLVDELPDVADALQDEIRAGATADDVRRFTMRYTGRAALAARVEQAAAHLAAQQVTQ